MRSLAVMGMDRESLPPAPDGAVGPGDGATALNAVRQKLRAQYHPRCVLCGPASPHGWQIAFQMGPNGDLCGCFQLKPSAEGYPGMAHGGVIATVLDGAMGNWLFAHGIVAVTMTLDVQYRHPLRLEQAARVEAHLQEDMDPVFVLEARIRQDDRVVAQGIGRFVHKPEVSGYYV